MLGHAVRRFGRLLVAGAVVGGLLSVPLTSVVAADAVDQSYTASGSVEFIHDVITAGQTFTAGRTGSLNRIDVSVGRVGDPGALSVTIQTTAAGLPTGTVVAGASVAVGAVPDDGTTHPLAVALPPSLGRAGVQYAIVLAAPRSPVDTGWIWDTDSLDGYVGGTAIAGDTLAGTSTIHATDDRTFATWVDSTPCAPGSYSATGFAPCVPADPGSFATGPGATSETPCALGSYQPAGGSASCLPAPIGSHVDTIGAIAAIPCPAGTTTSGPGATSAGACVTSSPPPAIVCSASPQVLWPPNNKLVAVSVTVTTTDAASFRLVSVTANGGVPGDIAGWTIETDDVNGALRASTNDQGSSRTYSLVYEASGAGGTAQCTATVVVPRDRRGDAQESGRGFVGPA